MPLANLASTGVSISGKGTPGTGKLLTTKGPPWLNSHGLLAPESVVLWTLLSWCSCSPPTLRLAGNHVLCLLQKKQQKQMSCQPHQFGWHSLSGVGGQQYKTHSTDWSWGSGPLSDLKFRSLFLSVSCCKVTKKKNT